MQATQPLVVPVEAPHELETVDELREVLLSEDEGRLVVFECFDEDLGAFRPVPNARVLPFEKRASLAQAYPSLAIHHVSLTRPHRLELQRALRFSIAPRWIVCSGGPQPRVLERRHFASEEQLHAFLSQLVHDPPTPTSGTKVELRPRRWWRSDGTACDVICSERWNCYCAPSPPVFGLCLF
ncbi:hypothetical protein DMC30DRAFT_419583, partial [Rhodotorula diobovata]